MSLQRKFLDTSLGFAAGVMLAASYWSLLAPAIEMAESSGLYGESGEYAFAPVAVGFFLGALFVYGADQMMHYFNIGSTELMIGIFYYFYNNIKLSWLSIFIAGINSEESAMIPEEKQRGARNSNNGVQNASKSSHDGLTKRRTKAQIGDEEELRYDLNDEDDKLHKQAAEKWKRILLLVIAITVHNIPGIH